MTTADLSNPILNSPFDAPERHVELSHQGPTGVALPGRRLRESSIPIPPSGKGKKANAGRQRIQIDVSSPSMSDQTYASETAGAGAPGST